VISIDDVSVGETFSREQTPSRPQLFRYSAITWNPHRIHYDTEYATGVEGHPDVLVQAHFHGAVVQGLLMDRVGPAGHLAELSWQNVGRALPDERLTAKAEVTAIDEAAGRVEFEVWTESSEGRCAEGTAAVTFTADS
jgi:hydroxyacyl-ACP dehydratase HTD2-like protein with hotdog domain